MHYIISIFLAISWFTFWIYWFASGIKSKKNIGGIFNKWAMRELVIRLFIALILLALYKPVLFRYHPFAHNNITHNIYEILIGLLFYVSGIALAIWARLHFAKNWGMPMTIKQNPELITSGPYRYVRHPIYSGILLALSGTAMAYSLSWLLVLLRVGMYFIVSAVVEEQNLRKLFPETYPEYMHHTKMLIPFIF
jgi:protein-S-isoprenylcysteine O-methyltransferase Ste14